MIPQQITLWSKMPRLIDKSISLAYDAVRNTHQENIGSLSGTNTDSMDITSSASSSLLDLPKQLFQMLATAGPYLYRDTILLQKVHCF